MALTEFTKDMNIISKLDDEPNDVGGLTSVELKAKFDEGGLALKAWLNETLLPALVAANLAFAATEDIDAETIQAAVEAVYSALSAALETAKADLTEDIDGVREDLQGAVMGSIPPTSVTYEKLASDVTNILGALQTGLEAAQEDIQELDARQVVIEPVTQTENGLMRATDKVKLDGIAAQATRVLVDNALSETSTNAIQNKAVREALESLRTTLTNAITNGLAGKANSEHTHTLSDVTDYSVDAEPTENSNNPVKSGGVYQVVEEVKTETQTTITNFIDTWAAIPMRNLGGLMAAQAHQGGHAAYAKNITADAFQDTHQVASTEHVVFANKRAEVLAAGLESGTVTGGTNVSTGSGSYSASDINRQVRTKTEWSKLFSIQPDAYGTLTKLTLQTSDTCTSSKNAVVKLGIFDAETGTMLLETSSGSITMKDSDDAPVSFTVDFLLEPKKYDVKIYISSMPNSSLWMSSVVFTVTAVTYSSGSVSMIPVEIPAGVKKVEVLLHTTSTDTKAWLSFDEGDFAVMTLSAEPADDAVPGGTACKLLVFGENIPEGSESVQLKIALSPGGCKVYDYAMILL